MEDLRYPIGKFSFTVPLTGQRPDLYQMWIGEIAVAPSKYRAAVAGLNERQLDTPYREGGWTVRQLIHHVPDSHMNAYIRFKLALTEEEPTIKPYDEGAWAKLSDTRGTPVEVSLATLDNLHTRWVTLLRGMTEEEYQRKLRHPERGLVTLENNLAMYAWHSKHHEAHITSLREREAWG